MAKKKISKSGEQKTTHDGATTISVAEEAVSRSNNEPSASAAHSTATTAALDCTVEKQVSLQQAPPQWTNTTSTLKLVPIYDLSQIPIDLTTGDRFFSLLDNSMFATQQNGMATKVTSKDADKKVKGDAATTASITKELAGGSPKTSSGDASTASTFVAGVGTASNQESPQMAQSQLACISSPLKLVPIYNFHHLPVDLTTGDRILPRLDKALKARPDVRLVPIFRRDQLSEILPEQSSTRSVAPTDNIFTMPQDHGGVASTSSQPKESSSKGLLNENSSATSDGDFAAPKVAAGSLELKNNKNLQLQVILPAGAPPMVPTMGGLLHGPGTKMTMDGNEDVQVCTLPDYSIAPSQLASEGEITFKNNKNLQLFSGGGRASSQENKSDFNNGSNRTSSETNQDESRQPAIASTEITKNKSSQIMALSAGAGAAAAQYSNISNNQKCQIMNVPSLGPAREQIPQSHALFAKNKHPTDQLLQTVAQETPGLEVIRRRSLRDDQRRKLFLRQPRNINRSLKSFMESVSCKTSGSKSQVSDKHPRLLKRYALLYEVSTQEFQDVVVDAYENRLRISTMSSDDPLQAELHYSEIKGITSDSSHNLQLTDHDDKVTYFTSVESAADHTVDIVSAIVSFMSSAFPTVPLQFLFHEFKVSPEDRYNIVLGSCKKSAKQSDTSSDEPNSDAAPVGARTFSLADLYRQCPTENNGLLKAIKYNKWFTHFNGDSKDLTQSSLACIAEILETNATLEAIDFSQAKLQQSSVQKLAIAMAKNPFSKVVEINLSNNQFTKEDVAALSSLLGTPNRGFRRLSLENTGITSSLINHLLQGIHINVCSSTLSCLNLSGLKSDFWTTFRRSNSSQSLLAFLRARNKLQELNLNGVGMVLEEVVNCLATGCLSHLRLLQLSGNYYDALSSKAVPQKWREFFSGAQSIDCIGFSKTKLPAKALKAILKGLSTNKSVARKSIGVDLDVSSNNLGLEGAEALASMAKKMNNIRSLNITHNGLKNGLSLIFESFASNGGVKQLLIGKNFTFLTQHRRFQQIAAAMPHIFEVDIRKKQQAMNGLIEMIQCNQSLVKSLDLTDSNLGSEMVRIIYALKENSTVTKIDLSGNNMGDEGAKALAEVLSFNTALTSLSFDRNNLSIHGLNIIAQALWRSSSLQEVAFPLNDIASAHKEDHKKALEITGIFNFKKFSVKDRQSEVSNSPENSTYQSHQGEPRDASTVLPGDADVLDANPSKSKSHGISNDQRDEDLAVPKKPVPEIRKTATNSRTSSSEGSSGQTTAVVHVDSERQLSDGSTNNKNAERTVSQLKDSQPEVKQTKSAEHQPTRLPPLDTENHQTITLPERQYVESHHEKSKLSAALTKKRRRKVQPQEPSGPPLTTSNKPQDQVDASLTFSEPSEKKTTSDAVKVAIEHVNHHLNSSKEAPTVLRQESNHDPGLSETPVQQLEAPSHNLTGQNEVLTGLTHEESFVLRNYSGLEKHSEELDSDVVQKHTEYSQYSRNELSLKEGQTGSSSFKVVAESSNKSDNIALDFDAQEQPTNVLEEKILNKPRTAGKPAKLTVRLMTPAASESYLLSTNVAEELQDIKDSREEIELKAESVHENYTSVTSNAQKSSVPEEAEIISAPSLLVADLLSEKDGVKPESDGKVQYSTGYTGESKEVRNKPAKSEITTEQQIESSAALAVSLTRKAHEKMADGKNSASLN